MFRETQLHLRVPRLARAAAVGLAGVFVLTAAPASLTGAAQQPDPPPPTLLLATVDGPITPVVADHLGDGLTRAETDGHAAYVVRLDTPGGLETSMRRIVQRFLAARVPVVVHVAPSGARAASAGAMITFAAHVAAMAPGTTIGAATPVGLEGGDVAPKIINDAASFAESVARLRGRNVEFAEQTVRDGRSVTADEAVELGAADLVASTLPELLALIDGRSVTVGPDRQEMTLRTAAVAVEEHELGFFGRIRQRLADPNLAFLFMSLGTLALVYELASPGIGGGGIVGVTLLLLGLFSLSVLPVDAVGLLFLGLAAALFVAELFAPGVGIAAAGGALALVLSGLFLFRGTPGVGVSPAVLLPVAGVVGGGVVLAGRLAWRARAAPSTSTGAGALIGQTLTVRRVDGGRGQGLVAGAWWNVRSTTGELHDGQLVRVREMAGLDLVVEPADDTKASDT